MRWPLAERLMNFIWPKRCVFCRKEQETGLCEACSAQYMLRGRDEAELRLDETWCVCAVWYRDGARDALRRYKFRGKKSYAEAFAAMMEESLPTWDGGCTLVTWIPLSRSRLRERGYDQCFLLAEQIARRRNLPLLPLLEKVKDNPTQNTLRTESERADNVRGAFAVSNPDAAAGQHILLVDDVVTSGATLREASRTLLRAGAASVDCVVFARAR